jgi:hypothetical protein
MHIIDEKESLYFLSLCEEIHGDPNAGDENSLYARSLEQVPKLLALIFSLEKTRRNVDLSGKLFFGKDTIL